MPTSAPGHGHICTGTRPHLRRDTATSTPGLAHICTGTCHRYFKEDRFLEALSEDLRFHVLWHRYRGIIFKLNLFRGCSEGMLQKMAQSFTTASYAKDDTVIQEGDYGHEM